MNKKRINYRKVLQKFFAYFSLTIGGIIFLIPFFWLLTTSMKSGEEYRAYPPRWLPPLPYSVKNSPFVATDEFENIPTPPGLSAQSWNEILPVIKDSLWTKIKALNNQTLRKIQNDEVKYQRLGNDLRTVLVNGILTRIINELRDRISEKSPYEVINELVRTDSLDLVKLNSVWGIFLNFNTQNLDWIANLPGDSIRNLKFSPKEEEFYLAAWSTGLDQIHNYRWEENLKAIIDTRMPGLWNDFIRFYGKALWTRVIAAGKSYQTNRTSPEMVQQILQGLHPERLDKNLVSLYRNLAISKMTVQTHEGKDWALQDTLGLDGLGWQSITGDTLSRFNIDAKNCVEMVYDFSKQQNIEYQFFTILPIPFESIERIILPVRGDLSFHECWLTIETNGQIFQAQKSFEIISHAWMGAIWQRQVQEELKKGGLTLYGQQIIEFSTDKSAKSSITADNLALFRLKIKQVPFLTATWRKFSRNYLDTIRFVQFVQFFLNSVILTILNIGAQILVCPLIAYGFSRIKWPGRDFLFGLVLATMMLPPQVTMIPQFLIFRQLGMYDTFYPLWLPSLFGTGFFIFLLRQFFMTIPYDYEEAAKLDGCGFIRRYFNISLPLIRPALAAVVIFQFMATWNDFLRPLIFLNSQNKTPLPLGLFIFKIGWWNQEYGLLMAASVIMLLPVILVFFLAQKHFIESISLTGAKG